MSRIDANTYEPTVQSTRESRQESNRPHPQWMTISISFKFYLDTCLNFVKDCDTAFASGVSEDYQV